MDDIQITVGSRELKTRLGTYLRHVRSGTTVIVTDRGRPVLKRHPLRAGDALHLASYLKLETEFGLPFLFVAFDRPLNEAAQAEGRQIFDA